MFSILPPTVSFYAPLEDQPGLADIDHIDSIRAGFPQVGLHVHLQVLGAQMTLSCKQHFNVLRGRIENRRKVRWRHVCGLDILTVQDIDCGGQSFAANF